MNKTYSLSSRSVTVWWEKQGKWLTMIKMEYKYVEIQAIYLRSWKEKIVYSLWGVEKTILKKRGIYRAS